MNENLRENVKIENVEIKKGKTEKGSVKENVKRNGIGEGEVVHVVGVVGQEVVNGMLVVVIGVEVETGKDYSSLCIFSSFLVGFYFFFLMLLSMHTTFQQ